MGPQTALDELSEFALHKLVADYLDRVLKPGTWWSTIPAGEGGGYVRGARWKARGARKGLPDLMILRDSRAYFIELKTRKGVVSDAQDECHDAIKDAGGSVAVCRSLTDVIKALNVWRIETREVRAA